jgi:hypothetical protein
VWPHQDVHEGRHRAPEVTDEPPPPAEPESEPEPEPSDSGSQRKNQRAWLGRGARRAADQVDVDVHADTDTARSRRDERENRLSLRIGIVAAAIGIPVSIATFYYTVFPHGQPCPGNRSGTLASPTVDVGVTYRQFLQLTGQSAGGADKATLDRVGSVIDVPFTADGYKGKTLPLRWSTLTAGGAPLSEPGQSDQLALEIIPEDCSDRGRRKLWAAWPSSAGRYVVELSWLDDDDAPLDTLRTAPFAVSRQ